MRPDVDGVYEMNTTNKTSSRARPPPAATTRRETTGEASPARDGGHITARDAEDHHYRPRVSKRSSEEHDEYTVLGPLALGYIGTLRANPLRAPVPTKQHGYEGTGHVLRPTNAYGAAHTVRQRAFSARWIATALRRIRDCF